MYVCMHVCVGECARMRCVSACVIGVNENENGMKEYEKSISGQPTLLAEYDFYRNVFI